MLGRRLDSTDRIVVTALVVLAGAASCGGLVVFEDDAGGAEGAGGAESSTAPSSASGETSSDVAATSSASSSAVASGSGGAGGGGVEPRPEPTALYLRDGTCGLEAPVRDAVAALTPDPGSGDTVVVAELAFLDECTGAGGQHLVGRAMDGIGMMWIGSHACYFFEPGLVGSGVRAGVVRARPGAFQQIPPSVCVEFPGVPGAPSTDVDAMAIAVFASLEDAEAFAAGVF